MNGVRISADTPSQCDHCGKPIMVTRHGWRMQQTGQYALFCSQVCMTDYTKEWERITKWALVFEGAGSNAWH